MLQTLLDFVDQIPPAPQAARYGNVAYRSWHEQMCDSAESFMMRLLPSEFQDAVVELVPYFTDSFGNSTRIDYGINFLLILNYFLYIRWISCR